MTAVLVQPAFQSIYPDSGDVTKFGPNAWNAARLFSGGIDGQIVVRDAASATGASWLDPAILVANYVPTSRTVNGHALSADVTVTKSDVGLSNVENTALSTGNAATATLAAAATVLATPRTINGVSFNGSANITVPADASTLTGTLADGRLSANVPLLNAANVFTATQTVTKDALAVTSTDALVLQNTTAATSGVAVQQSPRLRLRSQVWNTTATAATNTNDWIVESVPVSAAVPSGLLKFGSSLNGGAYTFPLTLSSAGLLSVVTGGKYGFAGVSNALQLNGTATAVSGSNGGNYFYVDNGTVIVNSAVLTISNGGTPVASFASTVNGQLQVTTGNQGAGVGFDVATDTVFKLRTRAQSGYATLDCLGLKASGVAGVSFGPAHPASITIVNGIVTAAS